MTGKVTSGFDNFAEAMAEQTGVEKLYAPDKPGGIEKLVFKDGLIEDVIYTEEALSASYLR